MAFKMSQEFSDRLREYYQRMHNQQRYFTAIWMCCDINWSLIKSRRKRQQVIYAQNNIKHMKKDIPGIPPQVKEKGKLITGDAEKAEILNQQFQSALIIIMNIKAEILNQQFQSALIIIMNIKAEILNQQFQSALIIIIIIMDIKDEILNQQFQSALIIIMDIKDEILNQQFQSALIIIMAISMAHDP